MAKMTKAELDDIRALPLHRLIIFRPFLDTIDALEQEKDDAVKQARLEESKRAEGLYKALMAISKFHGHCWCGECESDLAGLVDPHGYSTFICLDTKKAVEEYRAAVEASPAPGEGEKHAESYDDMPNNPGADCE